MKLRIGGQWAIILGGYVLNCIVVLAVVFVVNARISKQITEVKDTYLDNYLYIVRMNDKRSSAISALHEAVITGQVEQLPIAYGQLQAVELLMIEAKLSDKQQRRLLEVQNVFKDYYISAQDLANNIIGDPQLPLNDDALKLLAGRVTGLRGTLDVLFESLIRDFELDISDNITAMKDSAQQSTLAVSIVALVIFVICTSLAAINLRKSVQAIHLLNKATMGIAEGDYKRSRDLDVSRSDEFGELASAFSLMCDQLHRTTVSKDYVQTVIDSVVECLLVVDIEKTIETANYAAHTILGYRDFSMQKQHIYEIIDVEYWETLVHDLRVDKTVSRDIPFRRSDGSEVEMGVSAAYLLSDQHSEFKIVLVAKDVSVRKREEQVLKDAKDRAEMLLQSKSEFLANMSHELRTPLNGVLGMAQLLGTTALDKEQKHYARTITSSGQHLLSLINDVLDFSKIEAGMMSLDIGRFHLCDMLESALSMVAAGSLHSEVELLTYYDSSLTNEFMGDSIRIRQVLVNFIGNALKFTSSGHIVVSAKWLRQLDNRGVMVRLEVTDSGIGIATENCDKVFDLFNQADSSTTRKFGGTGLGLTISRHLTHLMNGRVGVESQLGMGSTFWIELPLIPCHDFSDADDSARFPLRDIPVLIIHPSAMACEIYSKQLSAWGADVTAVRTAEDAVQSLRYRVPENGLNLLLDASICVQTEETQDVRAVLVAHGFSIDREVILTELGSEDDYQMREGITFLLTKPVLCDGLVRALSGASKGTSAHGAAVSLSANSEKQVLLVEDNATNQLVASAMLRKMGHQVELAENGEDAVHKVQNKKYDIVFMDCQMPVLDGWEASRRIRQLGEGFRRLPIIALTANALAGDRDQCLAAGMNDYLSKPIKKQALEDMMIQWAGVGRKI